MKKIFLMALIFCLANITTTKPMKKTIAMAMLENFDKNEINSLKETLCTIKKRCLL